MPFDHHEVRSELGTTSFGIPEGTRNHPLSSPLFIVITPSNSVYSASSQRNEALVRFAFLKSNGERKYKIWPYTRSHVMSENHNISMSETRSSELMLGSQDVRSVSKSRPLFEVDVRSWSSRDEARASNTHVSEPREITCFSRDLERKVRFGDRSQLLTFAEPSLNDNLGNGMDTFVPKSTNGAPVETIVEALNASSTNVLEQADIVTYRNNLNKIGGSPYNKRDEWELDAVMVGRAVFLDVRHTGSEPTNEDHKRFTYYGYRFEALCTGTEKKPVNANAEFCSIARIRIASHRILLSCEIDCTLGDPDDTENALRSYIELKTMRCTRNDRDLTNLYRYRFPKYWLQSYLAGVRHIALGLRSDDGYLVAIKRLQTHELHREARRHLNSIGMQEIWEPFVCINFIDYMLSCIRRACAGAAGSTVRVRYDPRKGSIQGTLVGLPQGDLGSRILSCLRRDDGANRQSSAVQ